MGIRVSPTAEGILKSSAPIRKQVWKEISSQFFVALKLKDFEAAQCSNDSKDFTTTCAND
jgi:hypothetical protein